MAARQEAGRNGPFEVTAGAEMVGREGIDRFRRLEDAGVTRIITSPPRSPEPPWRVTPEIASEWAKRFADEVIAEF